MIYVKQIENEKVIAIYMYEYEPNFVDSTDMIIIDESEYNTIMKQLLDKIPKTNPDQISDTEALNIILGGSST